MMSPVDAMRLTARGLHRDRVAVEVVTALAAEAVPAVLLKGAAIATWLYDDGGLRAYGDIDLLVPSGLFGSAEAVLGSIGFALVRPGLSPLEESPHARTWARRGEIVDLHYTLWGVGVEPSRAWALLTAQTDTLQIGGGEVKVFALPGRALHVALHAAQHGMREEKPLRDLGRAARCVSLDTWQQAAALARELDVAAVMAAGLRLHPATAHLALDLGLPRRASAGVMLRAAGAPDWMVGVMRAADARGVNDKVAMGARRLFPTAARMRARYPIAGRGWPGLAAAHITRWSSLAVQVPSGLVLLGRVLRARRRRD